MLQWVFTCVLKDIFTCVYLCMCAWALLGSNVCRHLSSLSNTCPPPPVGLSLLLASSFCPVLVSLTFLVDWDVETQVCGHTVWAELRCRLLMGFGSGLWLAFCNHHIICLVRWILEQSKNQRVGWDIISSHSPTLGSHRGLYGRLTIQHRVFCLSLERKPVLWFLSEEKDK